MNDDAPRESHPTRTEVDALGAVEVPGAALYGPETTRAAAWRFTAHRMPVAVVHAIARIKAAAARVHRDAGRVPRDVAEAIERAAREVADGRHDEQFVVGLFQTGSGTSTHMNVNEVVANRASELLGVTRGAVRAHDHVNLGQSSNDVIPSAIRLAAIELGERHLLPAFERLLTSWHELADRHWHDVRNGRTHLMAAMPIRFGQQFRGYAQQLEAVRERLLAAFEACRDLPLGGTAVGTGAAAPPGFAAAVCAMLTTPSGRPVRETTRHLSAQNGLGALLSLANELRGGATTLYKTANDLRWQASDAMGEIELPAMQPGSSIMVGKRNPVVCEAVVMACARVLGNDAVVAFADTQGQFELNTMLPVVAHALTESIEVLAGAATALREHAVSGLQVRPTAAAATARNPILATALLAEIGHERAATIARIAAERNATVLEVARELAGLPEVRLRELLDAERLCGEDGRPR